MEFGKGLYSILSFQSLFFSNALILAFANYLFAFLRIFNRGFKFVLIYYYFKIKNLFSNIIFNMEYQNIDSLTLF